MTIKVINNYLLDKLVSKLIIIVTTIFFY